MLVGGGRRTVNGYIYSIVCIAAAGGIVCIAAPEGVQSGIKKHLKLVCALCLLSVMIAPVSKFINNVRDFFESDGSDIFGEAGGEDELRGTYESIYNKYLEGGYSDNVGAAVKDILYERLGIAKESCQINVEFADKDGDGTREPSKITVILTGSEIFRDPDPIKSLVSEVFECDCECAID